MDPAWSAGAELLADANALKNGTSALELSSAIVKVSRLKTVQADMSAVAGCHLIPAEGSSSALAMRIEHLQDALEMNSGGGTPLANHAWFFTLLIGVTYLLVLPTALPVVHRWTEWLVR